MESINAQGSFTDKTRGRFNLVIDVINTRPFLTPKFVECRIVALIHQLARKYWFYETPLPMAILGYFFLENRWLKNYRHVPTITVSRSTKRDLEMMGFSRISIVQNGLNTKPSKGLPAKADHPTVIYVGRMKNAKKPLDVIQAFMIVRREIPDAELWMVGDGYLRAKLESSYSSIRFLGRLFPDARDELVRKSWVIAVPGIREGWGHVVTDANALGTPAVGYNVPGLEDSIRDGYNGLLVESSIPTLASALMRILKDRSLRETLSQNAMKWASQFSWDRAADEFSNLIEVEGRGSEEFV